MGVVNIIERKMDTKLTAVPRFSVARDCASKGRYTAYGVTVFPLTIRKKEERMKKTKKYQLSQWEKSDRIVMEDFNSDNAKVEAALARLESSKADQSALAAANAALTALQSAKADKTTTTSLQSQLDGKVSVTLGSYYGTGGTQRISLGFTPKAVWFQPKGGDRGFSGIAASGFVAPGYPMRSSSGLDIASISGNDLVVVSSDGNRIDANRKDTYYYYVAFR